jgi:hypothetical protein
MYYYDRFVRYWADADAPLVPRREAVENRLDALRARAGQGSGDRPGRQALAVDEATR